MKRTSRIRMDYATEQRRRLESGSLFAQGLSQAEVARRLKVSRQSASRWFHAWRSGGRTALQGAGRSGCPCRLSPADRRRLERLLLAGSRPYGYDTDLWTLPRVAHVIETEFGVRYHPGHVWKLLGRLGWSCQRPERRARERDERAIQGWLQDDWPQIKKKRKTPAHC